MSKYGHFHKNKAGSTEEAGEAKKPEEEAASDQSDAANREPFHDGSFGKDGKGAAGEAPPANSEQSSAVSFDASAEQSSAGHGSPEQKYADLEARYADLNDQYLRKAADFENYRKRMIKEKQELSDFSNQNLILDLLPVIDDFERAIKFAKTSQDFASLYEGITMIEKRLSTELENKWGLKRFDSEGQPFDPNRHEALQMEKSSGIPEAVVKDDFVKGYTLKDRVIRFAKVKVLVPDDQPGGNEPSEN